MEYRSTYVLVHAGAELLRCEVSFASPFAVGQLVWLDDATHTESLGWFVVEEIARRIPYYVEKDAPRHRQVLAGQEIHVHLRSIEMEAGL